MVRCWAQEPNQRPTLDKASEELAAIALESRPVCPEAQTTGGLIHSELVQLRCQLDPGLQTQLVWAQHPVQHCTVELPLQPGRIAESRLCEEARAHVRNAGGSNANFEAAYQLLRVTAVASYRASRNFASRLSELSFRAHEREGWHGAGPFQALWDRLDFRRLGVGRDQTAEELEWRRRVMARFAAEPWRGSRLCPWSRVYTLFHACWSLDIALAICRGGFASLSTRDEGFYGQGIYFTGQLAYAAGVYGRGMRDQDGRVTVLVCDVAVGNAYPVIEHPDAPHSESLKGRPQVLGPFPHHPPATLLYPVLAARC